MTRFDFHSYLGFHFLVEADYYILYLIHGKESSAFVSPFFFLFFFGGHALFFFNPQ